MISHRVAALLFASALTACTALVGCAAQTGEEEDEGAVAASGDGTSQEAIVSEHQLAGSELPAKTLSLTFDDGPGPRTKELAEYLASQNIRATFFMNGMNAPGRQSAIDAVVANGHLLANHTQNHLQLTKLSHDKLISEITLTDDIIKEVQPNGPWLLRPPYGAWNGATARATNATEMKKYVGSVFWDIGGELTATSAADWACWGQHVSIERCGELYMNEIHTRKRGIVLMHDVHNKTVDMVKQLVPALKQEGYKFVRADEVPSIQRALAAVNEPVVEDGCSSSTLGRTVPEDTCVQSRNDHMWYRCVSGEWNGTTATDVACKQSFGL